MATFHLNAAGRKAVIDKLKYRVNAVKKETAKTAWDYLVNFGYHSFRLGGPNARSVGWSDYYAANWNQGLESPNITVITPERAYDEEEGAFSDVAWDKAEDYSIINEAMPSDTIFVTNSVWYGKWLNDGGFDTRTFTKESHPNRFMELCHSHLHKNISVIVKNARKNY